MRSANPESKTKWKWLRMRRGQQQEDVGGGRGLEGLVLLGSLLGLKIDTASGTS